jgi:ATP-dependent DNA helicase PIF1
MLSGEFLDHLSDTVKQIRQDNRAFGGVQLILCGDFLQLPPIERNKNDVMEMMSHGKSLQELHCNKGFAFQSKMWREAKLETIELTEVFRQSNKKFVEILQKIRKGDVTPDVETFLRRCERKLPPTESGIIPTKLYSKNKDVVVENNAELDKLPGPTHSFRAVDYVLEEGSEERKLKNQFIAQQLTPKEDVLMKNDFFRQCMAESEMELKIDAQVMLIQNFIVEQGQTSFANGSRGKVVAFATTPPDGMRVMESLLSKQLFQEHQSDGKQVQYTIVEFLNGERVAIGACVFQCDLSGIGTCARIQVPLRLAWSISIHKSQGMTLDLVKTDLKGNERHSCLLFCKFGV